MSVQVRFWLGGALLFTIGGTVAVLAAAVDPAAWPFALIPTLWGLVFLGLGGFRDLGLLLWHGLENVREAGEEEVDPNTAGEIKRAALRDAQRRYAPPVYREEDRA